MYRSGFNRPSLAVHFFRKLSKMVCWRRFDAASMLCTNLFVLSTLCRSKMLFTFSSLMLSATAAASNASIRQLGQSYFWQQQTVCLGQLLSISWQQPKRGLTTLLTAGRCRSRPRPSVHFADEPDSLNATAAGRRRLTTGQLTRWQRLMRWQRRRLTTWQRRRLTTTLSADQRRRLRRLRPLQHLHIYSVKLKPQQPRVPQFRGA